jgi:hypothetical protein
LVLIAQPQPATYSSSPAGAEKGARSCRYCELADVDILLQHEFEVSGSGFWILERAIWHDLRGVGVTARSEWVQLLATRRPQSRNAHLFSP